MLRKIRTILAVIFFVLITLLFLDLTGTIQHWFGWMAKIQFLPALLALNVGVVIGLVLLTVVFGRIYCSVICPLGVFQDVVSRISSMRKKKKNRFRYSSAIAWLRYTVLVLFIAAFIAGISSFVALISPYSAYGRIASNLFAPIYDWINNCFAYFAKRADSYAFYSVDVWIKGIGTFVVAAVTFIAIAILAWRNGRTYCNTICPVGTVLGFVSRFSLFKITFDIDKCNGCKLCSYRCKASCINPAEHKIDFSRCVACMDCIGNCNQHAISYKFIPKKQTSKSAESHEAETVDTARRSALTATAILAATSLLNAQKKQGDGGLAPLVDRKEPKRKTPLTPPGSLSAKHFAQHCTACQLCVTACTNKVLTPSGDLMNFMQPVMSYENGACRPECTKCADRCPTSAIKPITREEKTSIQIGHAVWNKDACIVVKDSVSCGTCGRNCPAGAIHLVPRDAMQEMLLAQSQKGDGGRHHHGPQILMIPAVDEERCIGCGMCEYLCPARPVSAIYVEGHEVHKTI